eukprot:15197955-Alexandrium_andersonii.AAC.1
MVPRCDGGRWGSVEAVEARLANIGAPVSRACLEKVLGVVRPPEPLRDDGATDPQPGSNAIGINEVAMEQSR